MAPRETEDNAYAKFWGDEQRALWYVVVFLEWSIRTTVSISSDSAYDDLVKTRLSESEAER